jgi:hypothetical protein
MQQQRLRKRKLLLHNSSLCSSRSVNLHRTEIFAGNQNMVDSVTDKQGVNMHVCSWRGAKRSFPQQGRFTRIKLKDQIKQ